MENDSQITLEGAEVEIQTRVCLSPNLSILFLKNLSFPPEEGTTENTIFERQKKDLLIENIMPPAKWCLKSPKQGVKFFASTVWDKV